MVNKSTELYYYLTLLLFCTATYFCGVAYLAGIQPVIDTVARLGYPDYFLFYSGLCSLCGLVVLLFVRVKIIKEFTYAGFFILFGSAIISFIVTGRSVFFIAVLVFLLGLLIINYYYYSQLKKQKSRSLMSLIYKKTEEDGDEVLTNQHDSAG